LIVYAAGTTLTALSPSLGFFILGWSFLEGIGAAIMLPAMMSLIVANFPAGPERSRAYSAFAAIAGIAAGVGPVVGGFFTTFLSWRLAFLSELLIAIYIFLNRHIIIDAPYEGPRPSFDWGGFCLSVLGLFTFVEGIVLASSYGFFKARKDFSLGNTVFLHAGQISPTIIFIGVGLIILGAFVAYELFRQRSGKSVLLDVTLLKNRAVGAGAATQLMQNLTLVGVIFALSLYVQMELNYTAIASGVTLLPLSFSVLLSAAISGRQLSRRVSPRTAVIGGFSLVVAGVIAMGILAQDATSGWSFMLGLILIGLGVGTIGSQNQNLVMSSVSAQKSNETSGILNTSLNIGSSLGTSLAGAIILGVFVNTATNLVDADPAFSATEKTTLNQTIATKAQIVSNTQLEAATNHLPPDQRQQILSINGQARRQALTQVYFGLGIVGLLGILAGRRLPHTGPMATVIPEPEVPLPLPEPKKAKARRRQVLELTG
jgi:MFS family permease